MSLKNKWAADLIGKDKTKALQAAEHILNTPDIDAWKCLIENADYLFSYIKDKAGQNLIKTAKQENLDNIFSLLKYHTPDWDYYIAEAFKKFSSDELNLRMMELLTSGTQQEKAYAAKYFTLVEYNNAGKALFEASKQDYQPLKNNAAEALGKLNDKESYDFYISMLSSEDDWDKMEAAQFLSCYGNQEAIAPILRAMSESGMTEHIAGEAANLVSIYELFDSENEELQLLSLEAFDNILSGISEVWTLKVLLDFKVYDCVDKLINLARDNAHSNFSGKYGQLLLKAKSKMTLFIENSQYTFDEEKDVINELEEIYQLLLCEDEEFWNNQIHNLYTELKSDNIKRKLSAISVISDLKLTDAGSLLANMILNQNETEIVICEAILALSELDQISKLDNKEALLSRIHDPNLTAIIQNTLCGLN